MGKFRLLLVRKGFLRAGKSMFLIVVVTFGASDFVMITRRKHLRPFNRPLIQSIYNFILFFTPHTL